MMLKVWLIINAVFVYFLAGAYLLHKTGYLDFFEYMPIFVIACVVWPFFMVMWLVKWVCELGIYLAEKGWKDE